MYDYIMHAIRGGGGGSSNSGSGSGKKDHKYSSRYWKHGRWNYIYDNYKNDRTGSINNTKWKYLGTGPKQKSVLDYDNAKGTSAFTNDRQYTSKTFFNGTVPTSKEFIRTQRASLENYDKQTDERMKQIFNSPTYKTIMKTKEFMDKHMAGFEKRVEDTQEFISKGQKFIKNAWKLMGIKL